MLSELATEHAMHLNVFDIHVMQYFFQHGSGPSSSLTEVQIPLQIIWSLFPYSEVLRKKVDFLHIV